MKKIFTTFVVLIGLNFNSQTISLDTSFGVNGIASVPLVGEADDLQILTSQDNKILAFGRDIPSSVSINPNKIYKFNLDGSIDTTFGASGTLTLPNYTNDFNVVLQGTDKILVAFQKTASGSAEKSILRYDLNGVLDTTFGTNGEFKINLSQNSDGFRQNQLVVFSDNSMLLTTGYSFIKLLRDGVIDSSYGTNGVFTGTSGTGSSNIQLSGSDILKLYGSKIEKTDTLGNVISTFGNNGSYTYPTTSDYFTKQDTSGNMGSLDMGSNLFLNISSAGTLTNTINLTNDGGALDYYINFTPTGTKYLFVGTSVNSMPFIVSYDNNGNLVPLNGLNSYKESTLPVGNYTSVLVKDNAIYIGGDKFDSATNKWSYIIAKYNTSSLLSTNEKITEDNSFFFENPVKTNLNYQSKEKINSIEIYSTDGKLAKVVSENNTNISELVKGMYIAKVKFQNGKTVVKKLMKN